MFCTDLTGSADGCVRLWEWGHGQPVTSLRQPGTFPKVTKVLFNAQGNKVGGMQVISNLFTKISSMLPQWLYTFFPLTWKEILYDICLQMDLHIFVCSCVVCKTGTSVRLCSQVYIVCTSECNHCLYLCVQIYLASTF